MRSRILILLLTIAIAGCGGSQLSRSALPVDDPLVAPMSSPHLLFDDEFDARSLDSKIWYWCYPWASSNAGCTNNPTLELEWYQPGNIAERGGFLSLVAKRHAVVNSYGKFGYTSGMISTGGNAREKPTFSFLYGYIEASIKMPCGAGMWPAFWLVPANGSWPPEIDMMEYQGVQPTLDEVHIHWGSSKNPQQYGTGWNAGVNLCKGYHTYAADWESTFVTWYFDGKPVMRYADAANVPHLPMYVILNLAIGGWVNGQMHPSPSSFPATMSVDWVRVWSAKP